MTRARRLAEQRRCIHGRTEHQKCAKCNTLNDPFVTESVELQLAEQRVVNAAVRAWQRANSEKVRAAMRAWQRANPDKVREATRAYMKRLRRLAALAIAAGLDK